MLLGIGGRVFGEYMESDQFLNQLQLQLDKLLQLYYENPSSHLASYIAAVKTVIMRDGEVQDIFELQAIEF